MSGAAFARYARYYDLLYRDKDYAAEARWVDAVLREAGRPAGTLLDVGCGTGVHAREFARLGWQVGGVDASADMIALALARTPAAAGITFTQGLAAEFALGRKFDAVVSLFHVASYHTTDDDLVRMLANVRRHLEPGGRFVFDFWHGPGVLADPPVRRERRIADDVIRVHRIATPAHDPALRRIDVQYDVTIEPVAGGAPEQIRELHRLRYFAVPELAPRLAAAGFRVDRTHAGITSDALDARAWYGLIVATAL